MYRVAVSFGILVHGCGNATTVNTTSPVTVLINSPIYTPYINLLEPLYSPYIIPRI